MVHKKIGWRLGKNYGNDIAALKSDFMALKINNPNAELLELINSSHRVINTDPIFGKVNTSYLVDEKLFYNRQSLNIKDWPGSKVPKLWAQNAGADGTIVNNYGYCVFHKEDGLSQYEMLLHNLQESPYTKRGQITYAFPDNMRQIVSGVHNDMLCTNDVHYFVRDSLGQRGLHAVVNMRSNDLVVGYKYDVLWQQYVYNLIYKELKENQIVEFQADMIWNCNTLHVYKRDFDAIKNE